MCSLQRAVEELHAERGEQRKTPRYASHMKRNEKKRVQNPKRMPATVYDVEQLGHAIDHLRVIKRFRRQPRSPSERTSRAQTGGDGWTRRNGTP